MAALHSYRNHGPSVYLVVPDLSLFSLVKVIIGQDTSIPEYKTWNRYGSSSTTNYQLQAKVALTHGFGL